MWGIYHALLFLPLFLVGKNRKYLDTIAVGRVFPSFAELAKMLQTFVLVMFGWIIFRAQDMSEAVGYFGRMFTEFKLCLPVYGKSAVLWVIVLFGLEWFQRTRPHALAFIADIKSPVLRIAVYYVVILVIIVFQGNTEQFIYFRF